MRAAGADEAAGEDEEDEEDDSEKEGRSVVGRPPRVDAARDGCVRRCRAGGDAVRIVGELLGVCRFGREERRALEPLEPAHLSGRESERGRWDAVEAWADDGALRA